MSERHEPSFGIGERAAVTAATDGAAIALAPIAELLDQHAAIISRIRLAAGITTAEFDGHYMRAMRTYAAYVQTLPATRSRHHTGHGGMLAYGLETAFLALQIAGNKIFSAHEPVEIRSKVEIRWRLAAFLTGLFVDIGMVTGLVVYAHNGERWEPLIEPLTAFANQHDTQEVLHHWRSAGEPDETEYRVYSGLILPRLLDQDHLAYLLEGGRHIVQAMSLAVSGQVSAATTNTLLQSVDEARTATIAKDERARGQRPLQASQHLPIHQFLLDAMRRLARSRWTVNAATGPLWKAPTGAYLNWPVAADAITEMLRHDGVLVPRDPDTVAEILAEHGVLVRSPNSGQRQSMYWQCRQPDGSTIPCIRIEPANLGIEDETDVDMHIDPDPNPIVMRDTLATPQTARSVPTPTNPTIPTNAADGAVVRSQQTQQGMRVTPGQRDFDFADEGPEGMMLLALANKIATGELHFDDFAASRDDTLLLRYPEAINRLGFTPAHMLDKLGQAKWVLKSLGGKGYQHDAEHPKWGGKSKAFILEPETTKRFLAAIASASTAASAPTEEIAEQPVPQDEKSTTSVAPNASVSLTPPTVSPVNTHTILVTIDKAYHDGEFAGQRIELITPSAPKDTDGEDDAEKIKPKPPEYLRLPFPLTYAVAARHLNTTLENVSDVLNRGPALHANSGHPVRNDGGENYILFEATFLKNIAVHYRDGKRTGGIR